MGGEYTRIVPGLLVRVLGKAPAGWFSCNRCAYFAKSQKTPIRAAYAVRHSLVCYRAPRRENFTAAGSNFSGSYFLPSHSRISWDSGSSGDARVSKIS